MSAPASTIVPPASLAELGRSSDAVVLAEAGPSESLRRGFFFTTRTEFVVDRCLRGALATGARILVDAPGGGGKTPVMPEYVVGREEDDLVLRNYQGDLYRYHDPRLADSRAPARGRR